MYITAAISVALVLCLVGMECVLLLSAGTLMHHMKENMSFTAVLTEDADSASCARFEAMLSAADYCSDYRYISSEEALQEHIESLGEDPAALAPAADRPLGAHPAPPPYGGPERLALCLSWNSAAGPPAAAPGSGPGSSHRGPGTPPGGLCWVTSLPVLPRLSSLLFSPALRPGPAAQRRPS